MFKYTDEFQTRVRLSVKRLTTNSVIPQYTREFILADVILDPAFKRRFFNFSGDLSGRYLEVMTLTDNPGLAALASEIIKHQRYDGRFGRTDLLFIADEVGPEHMALLWGNGRMLVGLMTYYQKTKDNAALTAAKQLASFLSRTYEACSEQKVKDKLIGLGAFGIICFTQLNEGLVMLAHETSDDEFFKLAAAIYPQLPERGDQHSHGYLSTLRGVMLQYQFTGRQEHLNYVIEKYDSLVNSSDFLVWSGVKEYFGENPIENRDEGCSEADFLRLSVQLYKATGEFHYLDRAEMCLVNALYFNQYNTGDFGHHHFNREGVGFRPNFNHCSWWCCTMHGLRALLDVVSESMAVVNNRIEIYFCVDGTFSNGGATVTIEASGPASFEIKVIQLPEGTKELAVRIPSWVSTATTIMNNKKIPAVSKNIFMSVAVKAGDSVKLEMEYQTYCLNSSHQKIPLTSVSEESQKLVLFWGPYALAVDDQNDPAFISEPLEGNILFLDSMTMLEGNNENPGPAFRIAYQHDGFPGEFSTILRPLANQTWVQKRSYVLVWGNYAGGKNRNVSINSKTISVPSGQYHL